MKLGFFVTFVAMTAQGFETSGDGTAEPDTVTGTETSSVASVTVSTICVGKCDLLPNTECVVVQSNSNGFACPCLAGFELDNAGQCTEIINDTTEEAISDNISTVSTATVDLSGSDDTNGSGVTMGSSTQKTLETTNPKIVQPGVTFQSFDRLEEKSTSGSILASVAGILVGALFL